jgi:hypothetical protein
MKEEMQTRLSVATDAIKLVGQQVVNVTHGLKDVPPEAAANVKLAYRHLQDAVHRLILAKKALQVEEDDEPS